MVNNILQGQNAEAIELFNSVISDKVDNALSAKKMEIASTLGAKDEDTE